MEGIGAEGRTMRRDREKSRKALYSAGERRCGNEARSSRAWLHRPRAVWPQGGLRPGAGQVAPEESSI